MDHFLLFQYLAENPRLRIRLLDFAPIEIETGVLDGTPDFALTTLGIGVPELVHEVLSQEPFILACPANHELATRDAVEWTDLADVQLIGIGPQSANWRLLDAAKKSIGVNLEWRHEVQRVTTAIEFIAAGIGCAVMPWAPGLEGRTDIGVVRLTNPVVTRRIGVLRRADERLSPAAAKLRRFIAAKLPRKRLYDVID